MRWLLILTSLEGLTRTAGADFPPDKKHTSDMLMRLLGKCEALVEKQKETNFCSLPRRVLY